MCLAQGYNVISPVRLNPVALRSQVKHSTTEPLHSLSYPVEIEPVHEISNNVVCATSKASDQPAHTRSLIRAFASRLGILLLLSC